MSTGPARLLVTLRRGPTRGRVGVPPYRPATFVHMVGRMYHLEKWVVEELGAELIDIVPIFHKGNPAFRVIYRAKGESEATTVVVMAGAGFAHNSIAPVEE